MTCTRKICKKIKDDLLKATDTYLRLPKPDMQYILLTYASYYGAGYFLMVEDYCQDQPDESKILAPVSFSSRLFNPAQLKLSTYSKEFLAVYYAFDTFAHILWGATSKKVLVLTDNKSLARFFQAKTIPAPLWNFLDRVMSFNFILGHIPGKANAAADFLSRLQIDPSQKITLKVKSSIPTYNVEMDICAQSPPLINEIDRDIVFSENTANEQKTHEVLCVENQVGSDDLEITEDNEELEVTEYICLERANSINMLHMQNPLDKFAFDDSNTKSINFLEEQNRDPDIVQVKKWIRDHAPPTNALYLNFEQGKYLKQYPRLIIKDYVLHRKFFDNTGKVQVYQIVVPKQLRKELLFRINNSKFKGHFGCTKTATEFRKSLYFPGFSEFLLDYVKKLSNLSTSKTHQKIVSHAPFTGGHV